MRGQAQKDTSPRKEHRAVMENVIVQNYTGQAYLVDVPVCINLWIRPQCQRLQFEVIKKARPSILFLISDGGRTETEWQAIFQNRALYDEEIDWDCTVYKMYEKENRGLYAMDRKSFDLVWKVVDRCIFLEDDILPSVSFFPYCKELLERYKDDLRVNVICGMNHLGVYEAASSDYFFPVRVPFGDLLYGNVLVKRIEIFLMQKTPISWDF